MSHERVPKQFALLAVVLFLFGCNSPAQPTNTVTETPRVLRTDRYSIQIPDQWYIIQAPNSKEPIGLILTSSEEGAPIFNPIIEIYISNTISGSLLELAESFQAMRQVNQTNYRRVALDTVFLNGDETLLQVSKFDHVSPLFPFQTEKCWENYRLGRDEDYILTFCAYEQDFSKWEPLFKRVMESFAPVN